MKKGLIVFLLVLLAGSNAYAGINDGLIAYYPFEDDATDASGNWNDGLTYGGVSYAEGKTGQAISFDGNNDYVMVLDNQSQQITTNQLSISTWVKLSRDILPTQARIVSKQQSNGNAWGLELFGKGYDGSAGNQVVFHDSNGSSRWYKCSSNTLLDPNQWHHLAAVDDAGVIKLYINGELDSTCGGGYGIPRSIHNPIYIGTFRPSRMFFPGAVDEVRIYNRALSKEEILELSGSVLSPKEMLSKIINTIIDLNLQKGISNSLVAKLETTIKVLDDMNKNNDKAAINSLHAFINAVGAQAGGKIASEEANALIGAANAITKKLKEI